MKKVGRFILIMLAIFIVWCAYEAYSIWKAKQIINEFQDEYRNVLDETEKAVDEAVDETMKQYNDILDSLDDSSEE